MLTMSRLGTALTVVLLPLLAQAACPPSCDAPGGGPTTTDCQAEFAGDGIRLNYKPFDPLHPKPSKELRCFDGDVGCDRDESRVMTANRAQFGGEEPEVGLQVQAEGPGGSQVLRIVSVEGDVVTLDGNHPLAGLPLTFDVTVVGVRAATKQELKHGHAHGSHGHDH